MPNKKKTQLKKDDCQSIAGMFADDLLLYHKAGGSLRNLTAKKVYKKLREEKEGGSDFSVEEVYAELDELKKRIEAITPEQLEKYKDDEIVDLNLDVSIPENDQNYIIEKLGLPEDTDWTYEQQLAYIDEALKLKTIREGENIQYLTVTKHDSEELIDVKKLFEDKDDKNS